MKPNLRLRDYLDAQLGREHTTVSLGELMKPFGMDDLGGDPDICLRMGSITENLKDEFCDDDFIDPIDVAAIAYSLGHEESAHFLDGTTCHHRKQTIQPNLMQLH